MKKSQMAKKSVDPRLRKELTEALFEPGAVQSSVVAAAPAAAAAFTAGAHAAVARRVAISPDTTRLAITAYDEEDEMLWSHLTAKKKTVLRPIAKFYQEKLQALRCTPPLPILPSPPPMRVKRKTLDLSEATRNAMEARMVEEADENDAAGSAAKVPRVGFLMVDGCTSWSFFLNFRFFESASLVSDQPFLPCRWACANNFCSDHLRHSSRAMNSCDRLL